ncbi:MAG TPA: ABC transporter ATP-binding protein/permease [Candidatus Anaerobutyricum stercoripullorum]|uniref:ABC transporter ATP-binding protein/permease n=1 Tax=Candidatus Anaerobutyricum stercoripullorum TaxID=2838456 RepID=A0A9D1X4Y7_9FIRM|nr:ABC transporter ATP-binding protein/permease [Candidatus Anaerobutyricum stercoripullorum]
MEKKTLTQKETAARLFHYLKPQGFFILVSIVMAALTVAGTLYLPILMGEAIDCILGPGQVDFAAIRRILLYGVAAALLTGLAQWVMNICNNRITFHVTRDIRNRAMDKIEILPLKYVDGHSYGDVVSRVIADVDQFADGLLMGFTQFFTGVITILGTIGFMFSIHGWIALLVICLTPISLFVARFIASHTYSMFRLQSETRGEETALIEEVMEGQKVVRAFGYEPTAQKRFDEVNGRLQKCSLQATFYSSLVNPCTRFVNSLVYASVALSGALVALSGGLSVGQLTVLLSYANQYTKPFNEISGVVTELQNAFACAARIFELIDEKPQTPDAPDAAVLKEVQGNVTLSHVDFSYLPDVPLIEDFNLQVEKGQRVAIVGPTGCGKTTVINLLMRFYDVNGGSIQVDGTDIRKITRESLRHSYGMVLQDTWLKTGTVRENITLGDTSYSDEEIIHAAKEAHSYGFIKKMPKGLDTMITDDGAGMSQGQKQLLCITRVMLHVPEMLILDEATSSIDTRTEQRIQNAFAKLMEGRTSFIVAHRLSTIQNADIILVMRDGKIIEKGDHDSLLAQNGFYANLYNSQFANV